MKPSILTLSLALAFAAPHLHAATFEGVVKGDGVTLDSDAPNTESVSGGAPTSGSQWSNYDGYVPGGSSRVSAISDGSIYAKADSTLIFRQQVVNPYPSAQDVTFGFEIRPSRTLITLGDRGIYQSFAASANFVGTITWGGQIVWSMTYGVKGSGSVVGGGGSITAEGPTLSASASGFMVGPLGGNGVSIQTQTIQTGCTIVFDEQICSETEISGLVGSADLSSASYSGLLNLGTMAGNDTKELVYTLTAQAEFEGTYRDDSSPSLYGYGGFAQAGGSDPFGIDFTPADDGAGIALAFTTAPVPEPQTYALLAAGLLAVGAATRRRRAR